MDQVEDNNENGPPDAVSEEDNEAEAPSPTPLEESEAAENDAEKKTSIEESPGEVSKSEQQFEESEDLPTEKKSSLDVVDKTSKSMELQKPRTTSRLQTPRHCQRRFRDLLGKRELRNEELEKRQGDLRQRLDVLECSMPAVMVWNIWRMAQGAPVSRLQRVLEKQFQGPASGEIYCPSTPSRHYDCRVREVEAERKQAQKRAEEARALFTDKMSVLEERRLKLEEAKRIQEERQIRIAELSKEAEELRKTLKDVDKDGPCETGECGDIECKKRWLQRISSTNSIHSTDIECLERLQSLAETEISMKKQIEDLEHREEAYMRTLQQADELWSKVEGDTASTLSALQEQLDLKTIANQQLADRICQLEDDLEKMRSRLATCRNELENFLSIDKIEALIGREDDFAEVIDEATGEIIRMEDKMVGDPTLLDDKETMVDYRMQDQESLAMADMTDAEMEAIVGVDDKMVSADVDLTDTATDPTAVDLADMATDPTAVGLADMATDPTAVGLADMATDPSARTDLADAATDAVRAGLEDAEVEVRLEDLDPEEAKLYEASNYLKQLNSLSELDKDDDYGVCSGDFVCNDVVFSKFGMDEEELAAFEAMDPAERQNLYKSLLGADWTPMPAEVDTARGVEAEVVADAQDDTLLDHQETGIQAAASPDGIVIPREILLSWQNSIDLVREAIVKSPDCRVIKQDLDSLAENIATYTGTEVKQVEWEDVVPEEAEEAEEAEEIITEEVEEVAEIIPEVVEEVEEIIPEAGEEFEEITPEVVEEVEEIISEEVEKVEEAILEEEQVVEEIIPEEVQVVEETIPEQVEEVEEQIPEEVEEVEEIIPEVVEEVEEIVAEEVEEVEAVVAEEIEEEIIPEAGEEVEEIKEIIAEEAEEAEEAEMEPTEEVVMDEELEGAVLDEIVEDEVTLVEEEEPEEAEAPEEEKEEEIEEEAKEIEITEEVEELEAEEKIEEEIVLIIEEEGVEEVPVDLIPEIVEEEIQITEEEVEKEREEEIVEEEPEEMMEVPSLTKPYLTVAEIEEIEKEEEKVEKEPEPPEKIVSREILEKEEKLPEPSEICICCTCGPQECKIPEKEKKLSKSSEEDVCTCKPEEYEISEKEKKLSKSSEEDVCTCKPEEYEISEKEEKLSRSSEEVVCICKPEEYEIPKIPKIEEKSSEFFQDFVCTCKPAEYEIPEKVEKLPEPPQMDVCTCKREDLETAKKGTQPPIETTTKFEITQTEIIATETIQVITQTTPSIGTQTSPAQRISGRVPCDRPGITPAARAADQRIMEALLWQKILKYQSTAVGSSVRAQMEKSRASPSTRPKADKRGYMPLRDPCQSVQPERVASRHDLEQELRSIYYGKKTDEFKKVECDCCLCGKISQRMAAKRTKDQPYSKKTNFLKCPEVDRATMHERLCPDCKVKRFKHEFGLETRTTAKLFEVAKPTKPAKEFTCERDTCTHAPPAIDKVKVPSSHKKKSSEKKDLKDQGCMVKTSKPKIEKKKKKMEMTSLEKIWGVGESIGPGAQCICFEKVEEEQIQ